MAAARGTGGATGGVTVLGAMVVGCFGAGCLLGAPEDCAEAGVPALGEAGTTGAVERLGVGAADVLGASGRAGTIDR